jgi:hypothetical protein
MSPKSDLVEGGGRQASGFLDAADTEQFWK